MISTRKFLESLYEEVLEDQGACRGCRYWCMESDTVSYGERKDEDVGFVCEIKNKFLCPGIQDVLDRSSITINTEQRTVIYGKGN